MPNPATAFREAPSDYGEEAADSEDEAETENEDEDDYDIDVKDEDGIESQPEVTAHVGRLALEQSYEAERSQTLEQDDAGSGSLKSHPGANDEGPSDSQASVTSGVNHIELESQRSVTLGVEDVGFNSQTSVKEEDDGNDSMKPFKRFYAYFDTVTGAVENGLTESTASEQVQKVADKKCVFLASFFSPLMLTVFCLPQTRLCSTRCASSELPSLPPTSLTLLPHSAFVAGGGIATDNLFHPSLTHLIVSKLVSDRYKELIKRTSQCVLPLFLSFLR
jgi:hypothetical protein